MDYPNNFNIRTFPAGKTIALSRTVAVWTSIVFFLIIALCGFVILGIYLKKNYPFLVSIDPLTEEWTVITYPDKSEKEKIPQYQVIQEKLVWDYVVNWFTISKDTDIYIPKLRENMNINEARWQECSVDDCQDAQQFNQRNVYCAISCKSDPELYEEFTTKVKPQYMARVQQAGETWKVTKTLITNIFISENASKWQVYATIHSTINGDFEILAFIDLDRDINSYPAWLGYYVQNFNSFRMTTGNQ